MQILRCAQNDTRLAQNDRARNQAVQKTTCVSGTPCGRPSPSTPNLTFSYGVSRSPCGRPSLPPDKKLLAVTDHCRANGEWLLIQDARVAGT
ncbi:MAG: hypothetical protein ABI406_12130, partial [Ktedonobacteraceae bacterium]